MSRLGLAILLKDADRLTGGHRGYLNPDALRRFWVLGQITHTLLYYLNSSPSHSRSLPLVMNSSESVSSGVSRSSTLMSRSSGVSRKSSDSREPSLWSRDRFISGAISVRRLRWVEDPPPPLALTWSECGGAGQRGGEGGEGVGGQGVVIEIRDV